MTAVPQRLNIQQSTEPDLREFFRSAAEARTPASARTYTKALRSFLSTVDARNLSLIDPGTFAVWLVDLWRKDVSLSTARLYLAALSALVNAALSEGLIPDNLSLPALRARLKEEGERLWSRPIPRNRLDNLLRLLRTIDREPSAITLPADLLLFPILLPDTNPATALTADIEPMVNEGDDATAGALRDILKRNASPKRKYLFPLSQSTLTPNQLQRHVAALLSELASRKNIPFLSNLPETAAAVRAHLALDAGLLPSSGLPVLSLLSDRHAGCADRDPAIAAALLTNPYCWFAVRLRPRVSYKELRERISQVEHEIPVPADYFYPQEKIAEKIGKKLVFKDRPFIDKVVFIRSRVTDLLPLFARVGDIAWCYTRTGKSGGGYAPIPQTQFTRFQNVIGQFTSDIDLHPLGALEPRPGEPVIFLSGPFQGREATVESIIDAAPVSPKNESTPTGSPTAPSAELRPQSAAPSPTILYRLRIIGDNGLEWRVTADPRHLSAFNPAPRQLSPGP